MGLLTKGEHLTVSPHFFEASDICRTVLILAGVVGHVLSKIRWA